MREVIAVKRLCLNLQWRDFAVLLLCSLLSGNHEYHTGDVDNWFKFMKSVGFNVLHNSNMKIEKNRQEYFYLAGTDDVFADQIR